MDANFEFSAVPRRYVDLVQRYAVLYALKKPLYGNMSDELVIPMTQSLIAMWRARIGALTVNGWVPGVGNHSITYARNCLPTFAMSNTFTRTCKSIRVCPFCYARAVRDIWLIIDHDFPMADRCSPYEEVELTRSILLDDEVPSPDADFRFNLVERHHYVYTPVVQAYTDDLATITKRLTQVIEQVKDARAKLIRLVDPIGAMLFTTVEHYRRGDKDCWKFHHRQLFKLAKNHTFPEEIQAKTRGRVLIHTRPTRRVIMQAVSRACRYPVRLIRGEPERTVQLLNVLRDTHFRTYSFYRSFRKHAVPEV